MGITIISWATRTVNVVHGCSKPAAVPPHVLDIATKVSGPIEPKWTKDATSPECQRCYAENLSNKRGMTPLPWLTRNIERNLQLHPERAREFRTTPVKDPKLPPSQRERFFVCSMGDIFHENVPDEFLESIWPFFLKYEHIYMLLTKRPDRAAKWPGPWPPHIWLGATCGHPATKWRLEFLRQSKAAVRFVSMEPMVASMVNSVNPVDGKMYGLNLTGIHQVITGGESGSGFRPMNMLWPREVRDLAVRSRVAYFQKQDAAYVTEKRCYLVEPDGRCFQWRQFPGEMTDPIEVEPDNPQYHREHFPMVEAR